MEKQPASLRRGLLKLFCSALAVMLTFMLGISILLQTVPETAACADPIPAETAAAADQSDLIGGEDSGLINILLIGQDRREEESRARSDSVILCTFRPESGSITITSFLRDLYVQIPGHDGDRMNAAYAYGGMPLLKQTLQENFGIYVDGCMEVDFSRFSQIIDLLGGVTMELRQDEAEAINEAVPGSLTAGTVHLTGEQALAYTRIRNLDADGDFSRTGRQRKLLAALLDSYRDAGILSILSVVADMLPMISTDLESKQILVLAARLFPLLDNPTVVSQRIPADGTYAYSTIRGMEVLTADMEQTRKLLRETLLSTPEGTDEESPEK